MLLCYFIYLFAFFDHGKATIARFFESQVITLSEQSASINIFVFDRTFKVIDNLLVYSILFLLLGFNKHSHKRLNKR